MKILVYGAGVIGSLYGAKLKEAGNDVTILARGARLEEIRSKGLVLENAAKKTRTVTQVPAVEVLHPADDYDLIIVAIPKHQIAPIKDILSANKNSPAIMFMLDNPSGFAEWVEAFGSKRFLAGFPGAGGKRHDGAVRYRMLPGFVQPTTIGEHDGRATNRVKALAAFLRGRVSQRPFAATWMLG